MNKTSLTLILILAALLTVAFLPGRMLAGQAAGVDDITLREPSQATPPGQVEVPASPVIQIAIGLIALLFGGLTILPLLLRESVR